MADGEVLQWAGALGDVRAQVWGPEGMLVAEVTLVFRPTTIAEFEGLLETFGGLDRVRFPERFSYYDEPAWVQSQERSIRVMIYPPPRKSVPETPPQHPFYAPYVLAQARLRQAE